MASPTPVNDKKSTIPPGIERDEESPRTDPPPTHTSNDAESAPPPSDAALRSVMELSKTFKRIGRHVFSQHLKTTTDVNTIARNLESIEDLTRVADKSVVEKAIQSIFGVKVSLEASTR